MINHRWLVPVCLALVVPDARAQYAARNDFVRDDATSGPMSVEYAGNDDAQAPPVRVVIVTNAQQGQARPQCNEAATLALTYDQSAGSFCPFDTFVYRVEHAPGQWSNEAVVFAMIPMPPVASDCNGNCRNDPDEFDTDCDNNDVPDACELPLDRRGVTVYTGKSSIGTEGLVQRSSISSDGRYVAFVSVEDLLGGVNCEFMKEQVYRFDTETGELLRVSSGAGGAPADGACSWPSISGDGSAIAFESTASNLATDANGAEPDVFVWTAAGIELVSVDDTGAAPACGSSRRPAITEDARYVSFDSSSPLVAGLGLSCTPPPPVPFTRQVYQHDRVTGATRILSGVFGAGGTLVAAGDGGSHSAAVNARGRYTAFVSSAQNLVAQPTGGVEQVFVFNRALNQTLLVSRSDADAAANAAAVAPTIDGTGFVVAYSSPASNLVVEATPAGIDQVYVSEITGTWETTLDVATSWVSRNGATPADQPATLPALSGDGRWVAFQTESALTSDDLPCSIDDVFVVDRTDASVAKQSVGPRGAPAAGTQPFIDFDGGKIGFRSFEKLALRADSGSTVYVRDRNAVLDVDGTGWLRVADADELDLDGPLGMTVEAWVRLDDVADAHTLVGKWVDVGADERSYLLQVLAGGTVRFSVSPNGVGNLGLDGGVLTAGAWHHVACTYDGASRRTYLDGELVAHATWTGPLHAGTADVAIGTHLRDAGTTTANPLRGRLDEVRVWSRALALHEIRWLIDEGIRGDTRPFFPDLVSLWSFEDGGADGAGGNDATPMGDIDFPRDEAIPFLDFDCDGNKYPDAVEILLDPSLDPNGNGRLDACEVAGPVPFCDASDGALAACPCANPGDPTSGCDNAQGTGGVRAVLTVQDLASSTGTLAGTGYPPNGTPTAIVIRSPGLEITPQAFFDGVRCVALSGLARLAVSSAVNGTSTHQITHGAGSGTFYYQIWYRNTPSSFCNPAVAANVSSGQAVTWQ